MNFQMPERARRELEEQGLDPDDPVLAVPPGEQAPIVEPESELVSEPPDQDEFPF